MATGRLASLLRTVTNGLRGSPFERGKRATARGRHSDAVAAWLEGAKEGDHQCQLALADAIAAGRGVLPNARNAFRWYKAAADGDVAMAQMRLAGLYSNGIGEENRRSRRTDSLTEDFHLPRDLVQARHWAERAAGHGQVEAQVLLGWLYDRDAGQDNPRDPALAAHWYGKAIEQDSAKGMVGLAALYDRHEVPGQGPPQAYALYRRAAEAGDPTAKYYTGIHLLEGIGTEADSKEAMKWLTAAATDGIVAACRSLGIIYRRGTGTPVDIGQAETWFRRAAVKGDTESMAFLADLHAGGIAAVPNNGEAIIWYTAAAEAGHAGAQTAIGLAHQQGKHVPKDLERAVEYFRRAADQEQAEGLFRLGLCYLEGTGIAVDYERAAHYLLKAAGEKHPDATYNAGVLFYHGHGVPMDKEAAMRFYNAAAKLGSPSAQFRMAHAHATGTEVAHDPMRALQLFAAAAEQGHVPAQVNLLRLLIRQQPLNAQGVELLRKRLEEAARQGIAIAMTALAEAKWLIDQDTEAAMEMAKSGIELGDPQAENLLQLIEARSFSGVVR